MRTTPTSFRLPDGALDRLRTLARPNESLASVIVRALAALESAPAQPPADDTAHRLSALETRLERLEGTCSASVAQPVAQPSGSSTYPPEVRRLAVRMQREGASPAAILAAIEQANGKAPDPTNLSKTLARWGKALAA